MSDPFIDTDVIIRFLTGDDLQKQADSALLFELISDGKLKVQAPDIAIADAVFVLSSPRLYRLPRYEVRDLWALLVCLPGFKVQNSHSVLRALDLYATTSLDFGDALIVAAMERAGSRTLYSYDTHFYRIRSITRRHPGTILAKE